MNASPGTRGCIEDARRGWVGRPGRFIACVCLAAAGSVLAVGCAPTDAERGFTVVEGWPDFQQTVLKSDRPVLVEFGKDPCPPCVTQKDELQKLAGEFGGRVLFASMTLMKGEFIVLCPEARDRYRIYWVPTTILFLHGQERKRWEQLHRAPEIREELKKALLEGAGPAAPVAVGEEGR